MKLNVILVVLCSFLLFGCLGTKTDPATPEPESSADIMVEESVAEVADDIRQELEALAKLAQYDAASKNIVAVQPMPKNSILSNPFPMIWNGPLEPAIFTIARAIGWQFETVGKAPAQPVIVQINSKDDPAYKILESCGYQSGKYVAVMANENEATLKIVYMPEREG